MILTVLALVLSADPCPPPPTDAPVVTRVRKGDIVPMDGVLESNAQACVNARRVADAEAQVADFKALDGQHWSPVLVVALVVVAAGAAAAVTAGACVASHGCGGAQR